MLTSVPTLRCHKQKTMRDTQKDLKPSLHCDEELYNIDSVQTRVLLAVA